VADAGCCSFGVTARGGAVASAVTIRASGAAGGAALSDGSSIRGSTIDAAAFVAVIGGAGMVEESTIVAGATGISSSSAYGGGPIFVQNTIVLADGNDLQATDCTGGTMTAEIRVSHSNWRTKDDGCNGAMVVDQGNNQSDLPLLADPGAGDFHQLTGSPTIDAGINSGSLVDFEGDPRAQGTVQDIGADEFGGADGDGVGPDDNCPGVSNSDQADADGDGIGDVCDDSSFDVSVEGAVLSAKRKQRQRKGKVKVKVRTGAAEAVDAELFGKLAIKRGKKSKGGAGTETFEFKNNGGSTGAGEIATYSMTLGSKRADRRALKLLKRRKGKATVYAELTDGAGNVEQDRVEIKVPRKKRK
jgi:hypothetical protein